MSEYTKALETWQTLPEAELFVWKTHAKKRAARIGGHVVKSACPVSGKWAVVASAEIATQYERVHARLRTATTTDTI